MKKSKYGLSLKFNRSFFHNLVMAVAVIFIWRGVWNLLDAYFLPEHFVVSNIVGIVLGILFLYLPDGNIEGLN